MKKTTLLFFSFIFCLSLLVAGCGDGTDKYGDFLHDESKIEKVKEDIINKADGGKIFQNIVLYQKGNISFKIQKSSKLEVVECFLFSPRDGSWKGPENVPLKSNNDDTSITAEDVTAETWDINSIDWKLIPKIVKDAEERVVTENFKESKLEEVSLNNEEIIVTIKGKQKVARYVAHTNGSLKKFSLK